MLLAGQHALAQATLADDTRLQQRITLWLKMEPLRDVLRAASRQTGVPLRCQDAIQHHKVSIFVENRPAAEILTQLASLFRYAWRKDGEAYVLYVPDETRQQEESVLRAGREARVRALRDVIRFAREAVNNPPAMEETEDSYWNFPKPSEDAPPEEWNRWSVYLVRPWEATREYARKRGEVPEWVFDSAVLLALLAKMPPQVEQALLNGQLVGFSTHPAAGVYPMPENIIAPGHLRGYKYDEETDEWRTVSDNPPYWGFWIRFPKRGNFLEYEVVGFPKEEFRAGVGRSVKPSLRRLSGQLVFYVSVYVNDHPWVAQRRAWATLPKEWEPRIPERALTERADRPKPQFPSYTESRHDYQIANSADLLEWFAWSTRLPVISEAFRTDWVAMRTLTLQAPRGMLRELSNRAWVRVDESGYVLRCVELYWGWRLVELPEDWLRPLEQRFAQREWLDLEDYIALAGRMTEAQVDYYKRDSVGDYMIPQRRITVGFPWDTLTDSLRGLRFLASLSAPQRKRLLDGAWASVSMLTLPQRQRFQEALEERFPPPERLLAIDFPYELDEWQPFSVLGHSALSAATESSPVEAPAFRLQFYRKRPLMYELVAPEGPNWRVYLSPEEQNPAESASPPEQNRSMLDEWAVRSLLERLSEEPGARPYLVNTQGYTLELQAPPARRKTYYIFQQRAEPVDVRTLEAKLKELEPKGGTPTNRP
jgi:hypothetical protein